MAFSRVSLQQATPQQAAGFSWSQSVVQFMFGCFGQFLLSVQFVMG